VAICDTSGLFNLNKDTCKLADEVINNVQMDCRDKALLYAEKLQKIEHATANDIIAALDKDCR